LYKSTRIGVVVEEYAAQYLVVKNCGKIFFLPEYCRPEMQNFHSREIKRAKSKF